MATKPAKYLDWVPSGDPGRVIEPIQSVKDNGYSEGDRPLNTEHNWLFYLTDQWIKYLESVQNRYESVWITSALTTSLFHNLQAQPLIIQIWYNDNGTIYPLNPVDWINKSLGITTTEIYFEWSGLLLDSTHKVKVFLQT